MTRVLITGAAGFVGRPLTERLAARGYEVHGVSRTARAGEDVRWHAADLRDPQAAADVVAAVRPDALVHLAWETGHGTYWTSPENERWQLAGEALLAAAVDAGVRQIVGVGSCAEYDWDGAAVPLREDAPLGPRTAYGAAKAALGERWIAAGGTWARLFFLFGPGEHPDRLVASVVRAVLAGRPAPISSGAQRRDFLATGDVADALAALALGDVTGAVNVGSGIGIGVSELARAAAGAAGDEGLVEVGALAARDGEPEAIVADVSRLRDDAGVPPPAPLDERLRETVASWRDA